MLEFIICLVAGLFVAAALLGAIKFWMRLEEYSDRLDYLERDLHRLAATTADALYPKKPRK